MKFFYKGLQIFLLILGDMLVSFTGMAQYTPSVIETGNVYTAVATDRQRNAYVVVYNAASSKYEVRRYANAAPPGVFTTVYADLANAGVDRSWGIAVNSLGDVYVTNPNTSNNWEIIKLAAGTYTSSVILQGKFYTAITTDASNNLLTMEYDGTANYQVARYDANGGNRVVLFTGIPIAPGAGAYPWGIVTDKQNNIYILDLPNSSTNGKLIKLTAPGYAPTTLATGKGYSALAIDAAGNLYTSELASGSTYRVMKYAAPALTSGTEIYTGLSLNTGALVYPWGLAVDGLGDVYVNDPAAAGNGKFIKLIGDPVSVVSVTRASPNPTGAATVDFTVTFSGPVSNVTAPAFSITTTGGISGSPHTSGITGSGAIYTVTVNTGTGNGTLQLGVTGISIINHLSNIPYSTGEVYTIVRTAPTGSLTINSGATYTNSPTVNLAITSTNANEMHFANDGEPYTAYEPIAATKSFTLSPGDGPKTVHMQLKNAAGSEAIFDASITLDQTPPATSIVSKPPPFTNSSTATFTFGSTESNSIYEVSLDGGIYMLATNPVTFSGNGPGNHSLSVRAVDQAGNADPTPETYNWVVDRDPPDITSVAVPANGYYTSGSTLNFTANFDENAIVNATGSTPYLDVIIGTTTRHATYTSGTGTSALSFSYTVQPGDMDMDGIALGTALVLNGATIRDAADNDAVLTLHSVGSTAAVFVNTAAPGVTISTTATSPLNQPFTVTATFTEAVTGFTLGDMVVTNATLSNLVTTDNITYAALVTPTADGPVSIQVPAGAAVNIGNNANTASNSLNVTYDGTAPAIRSVDVPANGVYTTAGVLSFTLHFSENVTVSGTPSLDVIIGTTTRQATYTGGSNSNALTFSYTVQNGDMDMDGIALGTSLALNNGAVKDAVSNNALLTLNNTGSTAAVLVNTAIPDVAISTTAVSPVIQPFTATITFTEAVTGFTQNDIVVTNASLSNLKTTDNITYTVLVTPTSDGAVTVNVPAGVAVNIGNNGNTASNTLNLAYDATAPVITSVDVPADGVHTSGKVLSFTVHYSENVTVSGTPSMDIIIGAATHPAVYTGGTGSGALTFSYTVQDGDMDMDGIALGTAVNGTIRDASGNNATPAINNAGSTTNVLVNTQHPSVVLSSGAASRVNAPFTVTITFSEAVTGFTATDINATNATASNLQTADNITYTVVVTPAADGATSINVPAGTAINIGGNNNTASNTLSFTYDGTAPVINPQTFDIKGDSPAGIVVGKLSATDAGGAIQNWTIATDGSGGAFAIDGSGNITVKDAAILKSKAGTTVSVTVIVSDGLNTSQPAQITINILSLFVNKAPTLDEIADESNCAGTDAHTIRLTGMSAVEAGQTYTLTVAADQAYFDQLTVSAAGVLSYQLKPDVTSGTANVTVTIKDNGGTLNGGADTRQRSFRITVNSLPAVSISSDKGNNVSKGDIIRLTATGGGGYSWAPVDGIISGQQSAVLLARTMANTTYEVTVTNAAGCSNTGSISISTIEDFKVEATNIISPNGDGRNDKWVIRNLDSYPDNEVKIFDRAGRMVYQRRNYSNDWDGTTNGRPLAEGTYYYILTINGNSKTAKGYITIIRAQ